MGMCGSKNESQSMFDAICPNDEDHLSIEQDYQDYLKPSHPQNLNNKYQHLYKVDTSLQTGQGIKKTYGYISKVSIEEIKKKRIEFWGEADCSSRNENRRHQTDLECAQVRL